MKNAELGYDVCSAGIRFVCLKQYVFLSVYNIENNSEF